MQVSRAKKIGISLMVSFAALVACSEGGKATSIDKDQLAGAWGDSNGGTIRFSANGSFVASGLKINSPLLPECKDANSLKSGSWSFYGESGKSSMYVPSAGNTSGESLALVFQKNDRELGCIIDLYSRLIDGTNKLCVTDDEDSMCGVNVYFAKSEK